MGIRRQTTFYALITSTHFFFEKSVQSWNIMLFEKKDEQTITSHDERAMDTMRQGKNIRS